MAKIAALTEKESEALRHVRNSIVHKGFSPSVRELARLMGYKSPRTPFLVLNSLIKKGWLKRRPDGELQLQKFLPEADDHARTIEIPLVGSVACGTTILAEENIEAYIPISIGMARGNAKYFLLRAKGDSMNEAGINDGDLLLIRQQNQAENGQRVVALIDDGATVKVFFREPGVVVLKPRSKNKLHKPLLLTENFIIQGVVVSVLPRNTLTL